MITYSPSISFSTSTFIFNSILNKCHWMVNTLLPICNYTLESDSILFAFAFRLHYKRPHSLYFGHYYILSSNMHNFLLVSCRRSFYFWSRLKFAVEHDTSVQYDVTTAPDGHFALNDYNSRNNNKKTKNIEYGIYGVQTTINIRSFQRCHRRFFH